MKRFAFILGLTLFMILGMSFFAQGKVLKKDKALTILDISVKPGQSDVDVDTVFTVKFDGEIEKDIMFGKVFLAGEKGGAVQSQISISTDTLVIKPDMPLAYQDNYTLFIPNRGVKSNSDRLMSGEYIVKFTTKAKSIMANSSISTPAAIQSLAILDSSIKPGQTDVDTDAVALVRFDSEIEKDIMFDKIILKRDKGGAVQAHIVINSDAVVIKPDKPLAYQENYTFFIPMRGIKAKSGGLMTEEYIVKFTTKAKPGIENDSPGASHQMLQNPNKEANHQLPKLEMQNFIISQSDIELENEQFTIKIPKGVVYPKALKTYVATWMGLLEASSGLSFFPKDRELSKVVIQVVSSENNAAYGSLDGITVAPMDLITDEISNCYTFFHELSHVLQMRNSTISLMPFMEGYAIMNSINAIRHYGREDIASDIGMQNYFYFVDEDASMADPERYYSQVKDWDAYLFGYRFAYYLQEHYGGNIAQKIIQSAPKEQDFDNVEELNRAFMDVLKACTSKSVFTDFKTWYQQNKQVFDYTDSFTNDVNGGVGVAVTMCMPLINQHVQMYPVYKLAKVNNSTLDFQDGIAYSQWNGYGVKGIFGRVYSSGNAKLSFYNEKGELIDQQWVNEGDNVEVYGAVKMQITGDGGFVNFSPDFKRMTNPGEEI